MTPFYDRLPDVGGFGVERTVDIMGAALAIGATAASRAHAIATGIHQARVASPAPVLAELTGHAAAGTGEKE